MSIFISRLRILPIFLFLLLLLFICFVIFVVVVITVCFLFWFLYSKEQAPEHYNEATSVTFCGVNWSPIQTQLRSRAEPNLIKFDLRATLKRRLIHTWLEPNWNPGARGLGTSLTLGLAQKLKMADGENMQRLARMNLFKSENSHLLLASNTVLLLSSLLSRVPSSDLNFSFLVQP